MVCLRGGESLIRGLSKIYHFPFIIREFKLEVQPNLIHTVAFGCTPHLNSRKMDNGNAFDLWLAYPQPSPQCRL